MFSSHAPFRGVIATRLLAFLWIFSLLVLPASVQAQDEPPPPAEEAAPGPEMPLPDDAPAETPETAPLEAPAPSETPIPVETPTAVETPGPSTQPVVTVTPEPVRPAEEQLTLDSEAATQPPPKFQYRPHIQIFDEPETAKIRPIREAAERLLSQEIAGFEPIYAQASPLVSISFAMEGPDPETILGQARVRALKAAAARLYMDNYFIVGRDLLANYLAASGQQFVIRTEIMERRILAEGGLWMRGRISIDLEEFYVDLYKKRFISEPNLRPIIAVHLRELINGRPDTSAEGRRRIEATMQNYLFRSHTRDMRQPPIDVDLTQAESLLQTARLEAQRHDVDILITGTLSIHGLGREQILYDEHDFQDAQLTLSMYRVDNGELIQQIEDRYSASGGDPLAATGNVLDAMIERATRRLAETLRATWDKTMLDKADFRLMFHNIDETEITSIINALKTLDPTMETYQKAYYGDVLVLNVVSPNIDTRRLERFLRESTEPQFKVEKLDERHFELDLL